MKWLILIPVSLFVLACCDQNDANCSADEIQYGEIDCIKKEGYTFYEADVNFYCFDRSILFGLDLSKSEIAPFYINTLNPVNQPIMHNRGNINIVDCTYCGFSEECTINNKSVITWIVISDKSQFTNNPSVIKARLLVKESVDFNSVTLDEKEIELKRRD